MHRLAIDILEMNFSVLPCIEQVLRPQAHANIGTLFGIRQQGDVNHSIAKRLETGLATREQMHFLSLVFQLQ